MSKQNRLLIGGYHAPNSNTEKKWNDMMEFLEVLRNDYPDPTIIYIDINNDVRSKKFAVFEKSILKNNWKI